MRRSLGNLCQARPFDEESGGHLETDIHELIERADRSDPAAADALFEMLYSELHRVAERSLRGAGGASLTLGPTTLLHEAYLNMVGREEVKFPDQARFLGYASRAMRGLVIDYTRRRRAKKRGRELEITLEGNEVAPQDSGDEALELERLGDALDELAALEPSLAELVDMHFFCGFTFAEIAALREVSARTVQRDWRKARLLLHESLLDEAQSES
ncbi:MAG: ECF-type sigma factor [Gemmatimonadota bacterium]|nr:ECF-type sigma factor [Gemmatimonadota bacterium]